MMKRRIPMTLFGVFFCAVAVSFLKLAAFGVDPFQSFMAGVDMLIPISFGTLYVIVNALLLIFSLFTDRHYIGIGTFINLFLLGYITQFGYDVLLGIFPAASVLVRVVCFVIGIGILCLGSSVYMAADLGVSTYDAIALVLANTWKVGKFKYMRMCTDFVCVIIGVVLFLVSGGSLSQVTSVAGIGTIVTAFFMGPLIEFFNEKIARPMLK